MQKIDIFKTPLFYSDFKLKNLNRLKTYVKDLEDRNRKINFDQKDGKLLYVDRKKYMPSEMIDLLKHIDNCLLSVLSEFSIKNITRINDCYFTKNNPNLNKTALADLECCFKGFFFFDVHTDFRLNFKNTKDMTHHMKYMRTFKNIPYNSFDFSTKAKESLLIIVPSWIETYFDVMSDDQCVFNFNFKMIP